MPRVRVARPLVGVLSAVVLLLGLSTTAMASPAPGAERAVAQDATTPPPAVQSSLTLLATGDLMCHSQQLSAAYGKGRYDFTPSFAPIAGTLRSADIAMGNLETTLGKGPPLTGYPRFRSPSAYADALKWAGFDVLGTANNHSVDSGAAGVRYTSAYLGRLGISHVGTDHQRIVYVVRSRIKVAFLDYTFGTNGIKIPFTGAVNVINQKQMAKDVATARKSADAVVMMLHWGTEYSATPEAASRRLAHAMIDAGADVILGSHPHVVRPIEKYRGHYIVYSTGNFISGQTRVMTDLGIIVSLKLTKVDGKATISSLRVMPVYRDYTKGAGRRSYRTVLIDRALANKETLISSSDTRKMRGYRRYCKKVFRGLL